MKSVKTTPKAKIKASPTERAEALLSALRPIVRHRLPLLRQSDDLHGDFARFFGECLPVWLTHYSGIDGLLRDKVEVQNAVFYAAPRTTAGWLIKLLNDPPVDRILSTFTRVHLTRALRLLCQRLEPPGSIGMELPQDNGQNDRDVVDPAPFITADLALRLEDTIANFATAVLFPDPQPKPATVAERKAARNQRLDNFFHLAEYRRIKMTFTSVCKLAKVSRLGTGSGRDWRNGTLRDAAPVCRKIEAVISFRTGEYLPN